MVAPATAGRLGCGLDDIEAIVADAVTDSILWQDYQRHETRQPKKVLEFLRRMKEETDIGPQNTRIFVAG